MTKEIFEAHRAGIGEAMHSALMLSKHRGEALHKYCLTYESLVVVVLKADKAEAKIGKLKEIARYLELYGAPAISMRSETSYCVSSFTGTAYTFEKPKLRDSIDEAQVAQKMQTLVRKALGLATYESIECKVMALFKDGHISWDEVRAQHGKACTL